MGIEAIQYFVEQYVHSDLSDNLLRDPWFNVALRKLFLDNFSKCLLRMNQIIAESSAYLITAATQ